MNRLCVDAFGVAVCRHGRNAIEAKEYVVKLYML